MKKIAAIVAVLLLCLSFLVVQEVKAEGEDIKLVINNKTVEPDVPPIITQGRTLVPIRIISEQLGAEVFWNGDTKEVKITTSSRRITLKINDDAAYVDDKAIKLDVAATITKGRTMLPLRFVSEALGARVRWDGSTRTVYVDQLTELLSVDYIASEKGHAVKVKTSKPMEYTTMTLEDPHRIVVDIQNCVLNQVLPEQEISQNGVVRIRVGQFKTHPYVARVVIDLEDALGYAPVLSEDKTGLSIEFQARVLDVELKEEDETVKAFVKTSQPVSYKTDVLENPHKIILDINNAVLSPDQSSVIEVEGAFLERVRMAQYAVDPNTVRVVFDLEGKVDYSIKPEKNGLEITLNNKNKLHDINFASLKDYTEITLELDSETHYDISKTSSSQLALIISGINAGDFEGETISVKDGVVNSIQNAETGNGVKIVFNLPYYFKHEVTTPPAKDIVIKLYRSPVADKLIVIDAGHGGDDPGAISPSGIMEKDLNLDIAKRLNKLLKDVGAKTFMIREADVTLPYKIRPDIANEMDADLFFSIHINAYENQSIHGAETLYCPTKNDDSKILARIVQKNMVEKLGLHDRGIWARTNLVVLRETKMPAVLAEVGYLTYPKEEKMLQDEGFRQLAAQVLCESIIEYYTDK